MMKKLSLLFASLLLFVGCSNETTNTENEFTPYTVVDKDGNEIEVSQEFEKIVSTAPSNTEVLIGLGLDSKIIAVDNYSPTDTLDSDVLTVDFSSPDVEAIIELDPDIIVASEHNKNSGDNPFLLLEEAGIIIVYISTSTDIADVYDDIEFMGKVFNREDQAANVVKEMKAEVDDVAAIGSSIENKKTVYFELGNYDGTLYSLGTNTFIHDMIETVGATNIFADQDSWITVSAEEIVDRNPDVIITNNSYAPDAVEEILSREGFETINAVKNGEVYVVDANTTSRGSQLLVIGLQQVALAIYPDQYSEFYEAE